MPDDLQTVGKVVADLNTRTGATGDTLEALAVNLLDFSRITKTDVNANVRDATRLFGDWSISTEDQAGTLDKVFRASQSTGIGVSALMEKVVDFGSPMRLLGFSFDESIALLSKWEKEGVNTETALAGLKYGVKTLAKDGVAAADMGAELKARIEAIGKSADPVGESIKTFGLRAGPGPRGGDPRGPLRDRRPRGHDRQRERHDRRGDRRHAATSATCGARS